MAGTGGNTSIVLTSRRQQPDGAQRLLLPGALVEVRSWEEIQQTLDRRGMLDNLPFMPEMLEYCGKRFRIAKRLERTCEETEGGMRRIRNAVFLENLRCHGSAHEGCQKSCYIFWKDAWLKRAEDEDPLSQAANGEQNSRFPYEYHSPDDQYICQSTELINASTYLYPLDFRTYVRDIRSGTYSPWQLAKTLCYAVYLRVRQLITGKSCRYVSGSQMKTPKQTLSLRPGEWVRVKPQSEIIPTLDRQGQNRGLKFTVEMLPFCGGRFRVLHRLERMISEQTKRLVSLEDTVILEDVTCDGCHILRGGCPRENYHYWREIWLQPERNRGST